MVERSSQSPTGNGALGAGSDDGLNGFLRHADEVEGYVAVVRTRVTALQNGAAHREEADGAGPARRLPIGLADLNSASFEQLREVGLSTTQAARLIARRDRLGGFGSVAELEEIPGLPAATRQALADRVRALRGTSHALPPLPPPGGARS